MSEGISEGDKLGMSDGIKEGLIEGETEGTSVGNPDGISEGTWEVGADGVCVSEKEEEPPPERALSAEVNPLLFLSGPPKTTATATTAAIKTARAADEITKVRRFFETNVRFLFGDGGVSSPFTGGSSPPWVDGVGGKSLSSLLFPSFTMVSLFLFLELP
jgi:hypothetical protein